MRPPQRATGAPATQDPPQAPAMKTDRTIEVSAVVTPNCAIDNRNHMSSHRTLQNPETKKNQKNHTILYCLPNWTSRSTQESETVTTCLSVIGLLFTLAGISAAVTLECLFSGPRNVYVAA